MKVHVITDLYGNPLEYLLTKAEIDDREALYELSEMIYINTLFGDKGYVGSIDKDLKREKGIKLYALKRSNSKAPLPKAFRNLISKVRRRIEATFNPLIEHFNIQRVSINSIIGLSTMLVLYFNILTLINGGTSISHILNFN